MRASGGQNKIGRFFLENGRTFTGVSFGHPGSAEGEVVFNTGMIGYVESLTDPSYRGQILVLSYPLIGNYGVPPIMPKNGLPLAFAESEKIQVTGLIVQNVAWNYSHWAARRSLSEWLCAEKIPALTGIDTRLVTTVIREKGVMRGGISFGTMCGAGRLPRPAAPADRTVVAQVSTRSPMAYRPEPGRGKPGKRILLIDCGVKHGILRSLLTRRCEIIRVPWNHDIRKLLGEVDGIVVSNGPGDPKACAPTIDSVQLALKHGVPVLGVCLGCQLLALSVGADTYKLKYGHRSQNQPCREFPSRRCYITSQNHGYAVRANSLPREWMVWFENANDGTVEGILHRSKPYMAVQFHPEASPGPDDTGWVFDEFLRTL